MKKSFYKLVLISILFLTFYSDNSSGITNYTNDQIIEVNPIDLEKSTSRVLQEGDPIAITDDESLAFLAVGGIGTQNDPFIIEGWTIFSPGLQHGISISGTTKHMVIQNNYVDTNSQTGIYGIFIDVLANNTVTVSNNSLINNDIGIYINSGINTKVNNNNVSNSLNYAIELADGAQFSEVSFNNIFDESYAGINIEAANSVILNNTISINYNEHIISYGIGVHRNSVIVQNNTISGCSKGINISPVINILVSNNIVDGCNNGIAGWPNNSLITRNELRNGGFVGNGIRLQGEEVANMTSNKNFVTYNTITNFEGYGINIMGNGQNNVFLFNNLISNNFAKLSLSQTIDNGNNNTFLKNYWSDWISPDENNDGYVDEVYNISGSANNNDSLPLVSLNLSSFNSSLDIVNPIDSDPVYNLNSQYIVIMFFILLSSSFIILGVKIWKIFSNNVIQRLLNNTLVSMLGYAPPLLVGIINSGTDPSMEQEDIIHPELKKFKFLLNPIRLSIIKYLYSYSSYPAFLIRDALQVSWGKFSSHVNSLIEKGYVSVQEEFYEGSPTRVLYIEYQGSRSYIELRELLKSLFGLN